MTVMTELFSPPTDQNSVRLAALMETLPLSRSSVFEIIRHLGIDTIKHSSGTGSRVAWLNRDDAAAVCAAAMDVYAGRTRICDLLPAAPTPLSPRIRVLADLLLEALEVEPSAQAEADRLGWPHALARQLQGV